MREKILAALKAQQVGEYLINETTEKSAELFFIKKTLDMKRAKENTTYSVNVYTEFTREDKKFKGQSLVHIFPGMEQKEIEDAIATAKLAASYVANPTFELIEPSDNRFIEMESDLSKNSLEENCRIMAEALFAEDTAEDVFINSAELFVYDRTVKIINSKGVDAGYRKFKVWGEFVAQCKTPQDVETYKDFSYDSLDVEALKARVGKTLEYTRARAQAEEAPATGNYRLILSDDYVNTLFTFYTSKADASYLYAGYSNYEVGKNVQLSEGKDEITGDKLTVILKEDTPFDGEGIRMKDRVLMDKGELRTITGSNRFASYLDTEPTGQYGSIKVECGSTSVEEMKKKPYLHVVNFSDFQMDDFTGHFGGEIRLGFLYNGEKVIPVTGGSVNGSWLDVQGRLTLSCEKQNQMGFEGPMAVCMDDIPVAGV